MLDKILLIISSVIPDGLWLILLCYQSLQYRWSFIYQNKALTAKLAVHGRSTVKLIVVIYNGQIKEWLLGWANNNWRKSQFYLFKNTHTLIFYWFITIYKRWNYVYLHCLWRKTWTYHSQPVEGETSQVFTSKKSNTMLIWLTSHWIL